MPAGVRHGFLVDWLRRHRLAGFFLLTFALSWGVPVAFLLAAPVLPVAVSVSGYSPLAFLAVWSPSIAAFVVVGVTDGWAGIRAYARRVTRLRGSWTWYAVVLVGVPLVYLLSAVVASATGGPPLRVGSDWLPAFVTVSLLRATQGPVEELGWRGFALPLLQRRHSGLVSGVVLGLVWALWHTPALVVSTAEFARVGPLFPGVVRLFAVLVATSVVLTVVFNGSRGSVPVAVLFHWLTNLDYPWESTTAVPIAQDAVFVVVAVVVAATVGRRYLGRENLATDLVGRQREPERSTGAASTE
jgi:membrane protease YdiL (CAAX protease family)